METGAACSRLAKFWQERQKHMTDETNHNNQIICGFYRKIFLLHPTVDK